MTLNDLRNKLDRIDTQILSLLMERFAIVSQIGKFKKEQKLPIIDILREKQLIQKKIDLIKDNESKGKNIEKIFHRIIIESRKQQRHEK